MLVPQWALDRAQGMSLLGIEKYPGESRHLVGAVRDAADRLRAALSDGSISARHKVALVAALVYLVAFWDIIPDFGPLGWTDDLAVIRMALSAAYSKS